MSTCWKKCQIQILLISYNDASKHSVFFSLSFVSQLLMWHLWMAATVLFGGFQVPRVGEFQDAACGCWSTWRLLLMYSKCHNWEQLLADVLPHMHTVRSIEVFFFFPEMNQVYCAKPQCRTLCLVPHFAAALSAPSEYIYIGTVVTLKVNGVAKQLKMTFLCLKVTKVQCELGAKWAQFIIKMRFGTDLVLTSAETGKARKVAFRHPCLR